MASLVGEISGRVLQFLAADVASPLASRLVAATPLRKYPGHDHPSSYAGYHFHFKNDWRESLELVSKSEHVFPFEIFRPGKQDYLSRRSVTLENFPLKRTEQYFPTRFSGILL